VDDSDPALAGEGDRHASLRDRVHSGRHDRDLELDLTREPGPRGDLVRQDGRLGRDEEDVVEGQTLFGELALEREKPLHLVRTQLNAHLFDRTNRSRCPHRTWPEETPWGQTPVVPYSDDSAWRTAARVALLT